MKEHPIFSAHAPRKSFFKSLFGSKEQSKVGNLGESGNAVIGTVQQVPVQQVPYAQPQPQPQYVQPRVPAQQVPYAQPQPQPQYTQPAKQVPAQQVPYAQPQPQPQQQYTQPAQQVPAKQVPAQQVPYAQPQPQPQQQYTQPAQQVPYAQPQPQQQYTQPAQQVPAQQAPYAQPQPQPQQQYTQPAQQVPYAQPAQQVPYAQPQPQQQYAQPAQQVPYAQPQPQPQYAQPAQPQQVQGYLASGSGQVLPNPGSNVLEVEHLSAAYGPYRALFDISFTVPTGGMVALIGSNGAGKSTVARTVTGLVPATSGEIRIDQQSVTTMPAWRIARMGVAHVVEGRGVFASLTVEENLILAFRQRAGRKNLSSNLDRAYQAFPILGERRRQLAGTLSGGQQRLLSLAKVLVVPPKLLVADELSLGLAPVVVDVVYDGLREINRNGTALLVVEQQVDRVLDLAEKAVVLDRGNVAYEGPAYGARGAVEGIMSGRHQAAIV